MDTIAIWLKFIAAYLGTIPLKEAPITQLKQTFDIWLWYVAISGEQLPIIIFQLQYLEWYTCNRAWGTWAPF